LFDEITFKRPILLRHAAIACREKALPLPAQVHFWLAENFSELLKQNATYWQRQYWGEFEAAFNELPRPHQAILSLLIKQGRAWSPFAEESMQYYKNATVQSKLANSSVQTAIQSLREKEFIWQSSRGSYALEDDSFAEWFKQTHK